MADVNRRRIVGVPALLVAAVFVGLALVLKSATYAGTLPGRDPGGECRRRATRRKACEAGADECREGR